MKMPRFDASRLLVVGDAMLDRYWHGDTLRISAEAPIPVVTVDDIEDPWITVHGGPAARGVVRLRVTDAGRLRDPEVIERMLDPFYTTKDVGKGTGLGLSVSRALMESLGGELTFDGAAENTTFFIDIPSEVT